MKYVVSFSQSKMKRCLIGRKMYLKSNLNDLPHEKKPSLFGHKNNKLDKWLQYANKIRPYKILSMIASSLMVILGDKRCFEVYF